MKSVKEMVAETNSFVECLTPHDATNLYGDPSILFVDLRDILELQREGKIPGAFHCPTGMLEFWIDSESPYAKQ